MANYGDIPSDITIAAKQSVRRDAADGTFEAFEPIPMPADPNADRILFWDDSAGSAEWLTLGTGLSITGTTINASTGITIGSTAISSGTNDRILYQSGGVVSQSANLTFDGTSLLVGNAIKIWKNGGESRMEAGSGQQMQFYGGGSSLSLAGFRIFPDASSSGYYLLNNDSGYIRQSLYTSGGTAVGIFGISASQDCFIENPYNYIIRLIARDVYTQYDASNYEQTTISSTGVVTRNAVGSGAKFVFSDAVEINGSLTLSAQNIVTDTTTGMKIGTGTTQKLGFFNATPVTQRSNIGALTDSSGGTSGSTIDDPTGGADTVDVSVIKDNFATLTNRLNAVEQVLQDLGLTA